MQTHTSLVHLALLTQSCTLPATVHDSPVPKIMSV